MNKQKCTLCGDSFNSRDDIREHITEEHDLVEETNTIDEPYDYPLDSESLDEVIYHFFELDEMPSELCDYFCECLENNEDLTAEQLKRLAIEHPNFDEVPGRDIIEKWLNGYEPHEDNCLIVVHQISQGHR